MLAVWLPVNGLHAQDTLPLNTVEVTTVKTALSQTGKPVQGIDSVTKDQYRFSSVADVLSLNTPVFIKSYGPGAVATTAFRGGNASQTAILWEGFNIQNNMLAQADLSLLPAILFDRVEVEYGGSASLWGSGAVGGSIHLGNRPLFGQGLSSVVNIGAGSFGLFNASARVQVSRQRFISTSKLYLSSADNNYRYADTLDKQQPIKRMASSAYHFTGLMQEFKFLLGKSQMLSVNAWLNKGTRRLPGAGLSVESKTLQYDEALRFTANWSYLKKAWKTSVRAAFFNDRIDYNDSLAAVFSKSKVQTLIAENENYLSWGKGQQLNFGLNATSSNAVTNNYLSAQTLSRISLLAGNRFSFASERLLAYASLRAEYFSVGRLPVTGNLSAEYKATKSLSLLLNAAKLYRQPGLNELYWVPGGNPNLKAEEGYSYEGSISYKKIISAFSFSVSGSAYSRRLDNWILWLPGPGGNPSPANIQLVWSRGTDTRWKLGYSRKKFRTGISAATAYVLSTVEENTQVNTATLHRQLIYTPRYTANAGLMLGFKELNLLYAWQYVGYRFTASDNSQWLLPYHYSSLRLNYAVDMREMKLVLFAACNNLFDRNYSIIAGRPMPLRNYELGITVQTKKTPTISSPENTTNP